MVADLAISDSADFLIARDVVYGYEAKGRVTLPPVLAQLDLSIRRGEFFCLLGPSGCGKTTVLNLMAGFLRPRSGTLMLEGQPIVTLAGQDTDLDVGDNVALQLERPLFFDREGMRVRA